jgi:hypothetical protein
LPPLFATPLFETTAANDAIRAAAAIKKKGTGVINASRGGKIKWHARLMEKLTKTNEHPLTNNPPSPQLNIIKREYSSVSVNFSV